MPTTPGPSSGISSAATRTRDRAAGLRLALDDQAGVVPVNTHYIRPFSQRQANLLAIYSDDDGFSDFIAHGVHPAVDHGHAHAVARGDSLELDLREFRWRRRWRGRNRG